MDTNFDYMTVFRSFVEEMTLIPSQLLSYNNFIVHTAPSIVQDSEPIEISIPMKNDAGKVAKTRTFSITFENLYFRTPRVSRSQEFNTSPILYPYEARDRNIPYEAKMFVDIVVTEKISRTNTKIDRYTKVSFGSIPVMVRSVLCNLHGISTNRDALIEKQEDPIEPGGYFIVANSKKGSPSERVVISQERCAYNRPMIYANKKKPKYTFYADIKSLIGQVFHTPTYVGFVKNKIFVSIPYIPENHLIPLIVLFKALGAVKMSEILFLLDPTGSDIEVKKELIGTLEHEYGQVKTQNEALTYIGYQGKKFVSGIVYSEKKYTDETDVSDEDEESDIDEKDNQPKEHEEIAPDKKENTEEAQAISYAKHLLNNEFIPHIEGFVAKKYYLAHVVKLVIDAKLGRRALDDKDHCKNKRVSTVGELMATLFNSQFMSIKMSLKKNCESSGVNAIHYGKLKPTNYLKTNVFSEQYYKCLGTGVWTVGKVQHSGVSQVFERINHLSSLSHLRKLNFPLKGEGKVDGPRTLHNSHLFYICPSETPEGKQVGYVKSYAMSSYISLSTNPKIVEDVLKDIGYISIDIIESMKSKKSALLGTKLFINGRWLGITVEPEETYLALKEKKCSGQLVNDVSIVYNTRKNSINISTDAGRFVRPLLRVRDDKLLMGKKDIKDIKNGVLKWNDLIHKGYIEIVDADESDSEQILIAMTSDDLKKGKGYTHCEIHPSLMFGVGGSLIPYPDCNQSPRNCYQCSMGKSAYGVPGLNYMTKTLGIQNVLNYPQKPLVATKLSKTVGFDDLPSGQNAMVAIMTYDGFNQEDSLIINEQSVQLGLFDTLKYMEYRTIVKTHEGEELEVPSTDRCREIIGRITDNINTVRKPKAKGVSIVNKGYQRALYPSDEVPYGVVKVGSIVNKGDILISKLKKIDEKKRGARGNLKKFKNASVVFKDYKSARVCSVYHGYSGDGYFFVTVRVVEVRFPELGDKWSSRHGQGLSRPGP